MIEYESLADSNIPFMAELEDAASRVLRRGWYVLGHEVECFEVEFSKFLGVKHCIGVANGLDALILSIDALGLPMGSDILVASNTYIATVMAIVRAGHKPVLVEPDMETFNLDPNNLTKSLTSNTKAICVTHLFGKPCRMDKIVSFAAENGLKIVEDCAQSHGASLGGKKTGTFGQAGCFSFYPTKNLGAFGDAGAVVTNDDCLAEKIRYFRNYGSTVKYQNEYLGFNSRLDELQASLLRVKLRHLSEMIQHKRQLAKLYFDLLPDWVELPRLRDDELDVFHIFAIRCEYRDDLKRFLMNQGVKTEIHYPIPPHRQNSMKNILSGEWPIADILHNTELSLPISFGHDAEDVKAVCDEISRYPSKS